MEEALGHPDLVEEQIVIDPCVITRLARVVDHGARAPFKLDYAPIHPGSFSIKGEASAWDLSNGEIYDLNGRSIGTLDYETGEGTVDWNFIDLAPAFWVRYRSPERLSGKVTKVKHYKVTDA